MVLQLCKKKGMQKYFWVNGQEVLDLLYKFTAKKKKNEMKGGKKEEGGGIEKGPDKQV